MNEIVKDITCELTEELRRESGFDAAILEIKVKDAYRTVRNRRCYQYTSYSEAQINADLYNHYFSKIKQLALYYYNTIGGEFQTSHTENGITRTWRSESDILKDVVSFVDCFGF